VYPGESIVDGLVWNRVVCKNKNKNVPWSAFVPDCCGDAILVLEWRQRRVWNGECLVVVLILLHACAKGRVLFHTPQPAKETLNKEANLLGDGRPSTCKHRCKNKTDCKHACCKPGYRDPKVAGNMTMAQYLTKIFKPHIEKAWREAKEQHERFILLEDNDGSHGTRTSTNIVALYKAYLGIHWYANSLKSPDLNGVKNMWRVLKQRPKKRLENEQAPGASR
jgi:hypothetical protein